MQFVYECLTMHVYTHANNSTTHIHSEPSDEPSAEYLDLSCRFPAIEM
jgi:hypothetical protein